jgi:hypothetical protein
MDIFFVVLVAIAALALIAACMTAMVWGLGRENVFLSILVFLGADALSVGIGAGAVILANFILAG